MKDKKLEWQRSRQSLKKTAGLSVMRLKGVEFKLGRRDNLLRAVRKLLAGINIASDESVIASARPRGESAERLYRKSKAMINRIDKEIRK
jgi:hypothetical protein